MPTDEPPAPTADAICQRGYFPRELPSAFTTEAFGRADREADGRLPPTESVTHNLARVTGARRLLKVPNPQAFAHLAKVTEQLWPEALKDHLAQSTTAISTPAIGTSERGRAIRPRRRFGEKSKYSARIRARGRVILQTDITQFYGSIYTHSIPWALHGRSEAKSRRRDSSLAGNRLDQALQALSHGETSGLPIGPDPSFLAAEVLLTAVDVQLRDKHPDVHWFRYLDDYEFACANGDEAQEVLGTLQSALGALRLDTNPAKTAILDLPAPFQESWTYEFQRFDVRQGTATQTANDLLALFNRASELSREHPGALKYALLICREVEIPETRPRPSWTAWCVRTRPPATAARCSGRSGPRSS